MDLVYLTIAFTLNSIANIFLKIAARSGVLTGEWKVSQVLSNYYLLGGVVLFAFNLLFYLLAIRSFPLSVAYPVMIVMSFLIINSYSYFGFGENIHPLQVAGYLFVIVGIILVFYFSK